MDKMVSRKPRWRKQIRFHIYTAGGSKRTTISLHYRLVYYLTMTLGHEPNSMAGNRAVTEWIQQQFDQNMDTAYDGRQSISFFMQEYAFDKIVDNQLSDQLLEWELENDG